MISMKPTMLFILSLSLSLIIISCKKSEMLADPPSTNGISIKFYNYNNDFIEKFNLNNLSSIKLNELPSLSLKTYYHELSFHPTTTSDTNKNVQIFFLIKDNVLGKITPYSVFLYGYCYYNYYGIWGKAAYNDSSFINATVYAFLVKDLNSIISDTINFEITHDGVKEIIPVIPNKNIMELYGSLVINKNLLDNNETHSLRYKLFCNENEKLGFIVNDYEYNKLTYWGIEYLNPGEFHNNFYTCSRYSEELKLYAFKLIY